MSKKNNLRIRQQPGVRYGPDTSSCSAELLPDLIRKRAYQLFEARGYQPGLELEDWLKAEVEIKKQFNVTELPERPER